MALLGKWWWRSKERGSLRFRVLVARFGEVDHFLHAEEKRGSVWWSNLVSIVRGVSTCVGDWIDDNSMSELAVMIIPFYFGGILG